MGVISYKASEEHEPNKLGLNKSFWVRRRKCVVNLSSIKVGTSHSKTAL